MTSYRLTIKLSAQKELDALSESLFTRIDRKILLLSQNPRPAGCRKLKGFKDLWRIRVGSYRVVYRLDDDRSEVEITRVAHRSDVYE